MFTAFAIGLLGSLHCAGMCGPIVLALPGNRVNYDFLWKRVLYNGGRIVTYAAIGLLFGLLGEGLALAGFQQIISIATGVLLLLMLLFPYIQRSVNTTPSAWGRWVARVKTMLGSRLKSGSARSLFSIGLLNGLLPCGLVYLALAGALTSGSAVHGALYMLVFGIGTMPMLLGVAYGGQVMSPRLRHKLSRALPAFVFILACLFIVRGLGLGIPFLSPTIGFGIDNAPICY
jgi:sulfite exporter TauE/SafE